MNETVLTIVLTTVLAFLAGAWYESKLHKCKPTGRSNVQAAKQEVLNAAKRGGPVLAVKVFCKAASADFQGLRDEWEPYAAMLTRLLEGTEIPAERLRWMKAAISATARGAEPKYAEVLPGIGYVFERLCGTTKVPSGADGQIPDNW